VKVDSKKDSRTADARREEKGKAWPWRENRNVANEGDFRSDLKKLNYIELKFQVRIRY
jgi:hypothetical protein